jgi:hypothetical protein
MYKSPGNTLFYINSNMAKSDRPIPVVAYAEESTPGGRPAKGMYSWLLIFVLKLKFLTTLLLCAGDWPGAQSAATAACPPLVIPGISGHRGIELESWEIVPAFHSESQIHCTKTAAFPSASTTLLASEGKKLKQAV